MSLAIVHSRAQLGIGAPAVTVEVHLTNGLPGLSIVGMPETAVKESIARTPTKYPRQWPDHNDHPL